MRFIIRNLSDQFSPRSLKPQMVSTVSNDHQIQKLERSNKLEHNESDRIQSEDTFEAIIIVVEDRNSHDHAWH